MRLSGVVVADREVHIPALPLFYLVATLDKLLTRIASPVFSAPRNWDTKGSIRFGLDRFNGLTDRVR